MEPGKSYVSSFPDDSDVQAGLGSTGTEPSSSSSLGQLRARGRGGTRREERTGRQLWRKVGAECGGADEFTSPSQAGGS